MGNNLSLKHSIFKYPQYITVSCLFFFISFLITTQFKVAGLAIIGFLTLFILYHLLIEKKILLAKEDINVFILFYLIHYISLSAGSIINFFINGVLYMEYYPAIFGRMINITVCMLFFIYVTNNKNKKELSTAIIFNSYFYGCCILLVFGLWQLSAMLFNVPYPDINTRDFIHSMDTTLLPVFINRRITSIADEPAYLIPYLIDAIIIIFFTNKRKITIIPFVIVLLFSLSLSGYINFLIVTVVVFALKKMNKTKIITICLIVPIILYFIISQQNILISIFSRLNPEVLFKSVRLQEILLPIKFVFFNSSIFNQLFGYGPKGFGFISQFIFYKHGFLAGQNVTAETHIIFADYLIEYGLIGLILIIALFIYLYIIARKTYNITKNRLAQVLCINLFVTSLYTSDYASPRFTAIILLINILYKDCKSIRRYKEFNEWL
ncbi:MAG: hypothetical protein LBQ88_12955 [Treponema sp.]|jgi:hypothetical protein|nr:hypothetical protein [Treponema sp.]